MSKDFIHFCLIEWGKENKVSATDVTRISYIILQSVFLSVFFDKSYILYIICSVLCAFYVLLCCKRNFPLGTIKLMLESEQFDICKPQFVTFTTAYNQLSMYSNRWGTVQGNLQLKVRQIDQENQDNSGCQCLHILCFYKLLIEHVRNECGGRWKTLESTQQLRGNRAASWPKWKRN